MVFFCIKTTKHLDIHRDMKKFSPVDCCIDKRQKKSGYRQNKIHRMIKREHLCFQYRLCPPLASLTATQRPHMDLSTFLNTA